MADGSPVIFNDLETEGFVRRAKVVLELHVSCARMLEALIGAAGRPVHAEILDGMADARWLAARRDGDGRRRVATKICWLRDALADVGFSRDVIDCHDGGYALDVAAAAAIQRFVLRGRPD